MNKPLFLAELTDGAGNCCELELPASDYQVLDAMERLGGGSAGVPDCTVVHYYDYSFLAPVLEKQRSLCAFNTLAEKLAELDPIQATAFEGLVTMVSQKHPGPIKLVRLFCLAHNTDSCNTAPARNDRELGKFYADNGFLPELEDVPECVYNLLDFEKIGRKARESEQGVFTSGGYAVQTGKISPVHAEMEHPFQKPDYMLRLTLGTPNTSRSAALELPADKEKTAAVLTVLNISSLEQAEVQHCDGPVPLEVLGLQRLKHPDKLNVLAQMMQAMEERDELATYKAVLHAADCRKLEDALYLAQNIEHYRLEPAQHSPVDVARDALALALDRERAEQLLPYVDLYSYGKALLNSQNAVLTPYGLVQRRDGEPICITAPFRSYGMLEMN